MKKSVLFLLLVLLLTACAPKAISDGRYTVEVATAGGTGKARVLSPAELTVEDGRLTATITWSSKHYDYMLVNGVKYLPLSNEEGSVFAFPLEALGEVAVVADTVAMSTPHEIAYTLTFDAKSVEAVK